MTKTVWPVNGNGEIVFRSGTGSDTVSGYLSQDVLPSGDDGVPIKLAGLDGLVRESDVPILSFDSTSIPDKAVIYFADRDTVGDCGGGNLRFVAGSTAPADGGTVYAVTGGRLIRELFTTVDVRWFGAKGDGVTNDSTAVQAAIDSLGAAGGTVCLRNGDRYLLDTSLTIKPNVTLKGQFSRVGSPDNNASYPYGSVSAILLNPSTTITLKGGSGIDGCLVYRKGMVFPASDSSAFSGDAFTVGGDDAFVINSMILGFNKALVSTGWQRPRVDNVNIDCQSGIEINTCYDIAYINKVHCWPFVTVATGTAASLHRTGTAFLLNGVADWAKITDCFAYGYTKGFWAIGVDDVVFTNCAVDGTQALSGSIGFAITGDSLRIRMVGCNVSSQDQALYYAATAGIYSRAEVIGCNFTTSAVRNVLVDSSADLSFVGTHFGNSPYAIGVSANAATSKISVSACRFSNITTKPFSLSVPIKTMLIDSNNDFGNFVGDPIGTGFHIPSVASASPLVVPNTGNVFEVTGSTGFSVINYGWAGRELTLIFTSAITISSGGGTGGLNLASTFNAVAGSVLTLVNNGDTWFETGRK